MGLEEITRDDLFYQISLVFCDDGIISPNEFTLLKEIARLVDLDGEKANQIANTAIKKYKSGNHKKEMDLTPDEIYQATLMNFSSDGIIDQLEDQALQALRKILKADPKNFVSIEKDYYADKKIKLKPLTCKYCQGLVPFEKKEWITCPYCSKKLDVPQTYLDTVVARKAIKKKKSEIDKFIENFKQPTKLENFICSVPDQILLGIFTLTFMFSYNIFEAVPFYQISYFAKTIYKVNLIELIPLNSFHYFLIKFGFYYVLLSLPFVYVYLTKRKIMALSEIQYALSANPPGLKGKATTCNKCGGALKTCEDSFSIVCGYCETANIISLREKQIGMTKATYSNVSADLVAAIKQYKSGGKRLIKSILVLNILLIFFGLVLWEINGAPEKNEILPLIGTKSAELGSLVHISGKRFSFDKWATLKAIDIASNQNRPWANFYFFMKADETVNFEWQPIPQVVEKKIAERESPDFVLYEKIEASVYLTQNFNNNGRLSKELIFNTDAKMKQAVNFKAPLTGCYTISLKFPCIKKLLSNKDFYYLDAFKLKVSSPGNQ